MSFLLAEILSALSIKSETTEDESFTHELIKLRAQIDRLDEELIHTLKLRKSVVEKIAQAKIEQNITALQRSRFDQLMKERMIAAANLGMDSEFIKEIFNAIHEDSIRIQTDLFQKNKK